MLRWILLVVLLLVLTIYIIQIFGHDPLPPHSGMKEIDMPLNTYGFGATKRLLVFDLTEIGNAENIDLSDKKFAKLTISESGNNESYTIGIEVKGSGLSERKKLNLAFEFWSAIEDDTPCTSIATCEDDKEEIFDFGEKYEDWVLRGGYNEQTLTRDAAAFSLVGGMLEYRLVEVLFKFGEKHTYEGVYLLIPAIQRRFIEKKMKWESGGKKEDCDDKDYNINKVSLIMEHTIASRGRKYPCELFKQYSVKMRYPKCEFYDEEGVATCREEYMDRTNHFASVLNWKNTSEVTLNIQSFVNTYYAEMLMREDDFPYTSQYFYVNPDDSKLYSGPRWDYDGTYWRVASVTGWHINNLGYYPQDPIQLWVHLGKHQPFIDAVKINNHTILQNKQIYFNVLSQRLQQYKNGYFDREIERWGLFNKKRPLQTDIVSVNYGVDGKSKESFEDEIEFMKKKVEDRTEWMLQHIDAFNGFEVSNKNNQHTILVLNLLLPTLLLTVTIGYWIYYVVEQKDFDYMFTRVISNNVKYRKLEYRVDI